MKKTYATIRKDLRESKIAVPIGKKFSLTDKPLLYRWFGNRFQVKHNGNWKEAESIDFDF